MRIACFTPLSPSKSGIADYNEELLPLLARGADITVFVEHERELRAHRDQRDFAVRDFLHFEGMNSERPFDLCIYHLGNNPFHEFAYDAAIRNPGLVVLHENCLHHLLTLKTLDRDDTAGYRELMFQAYGRRGARLADARERGISSDFQQFAMPLNYQVAARSLGIITHNEFAASGIEIPIDIPLTKRMPDALATAPLVKVIPHHLSPKVDELMGWDNAEIRSRYGFPEDTLIFGLFGFVTESKRIPLVLKAYKRLRSQVPNSRLVIVGEDHWKWSVTPLISDLDLDDFVRITGYTTERDFFEYLKITDIVVNLRYPTAGESSGTLVRAMGAGKPCIVTEYGQHADLPDDICLKVPIGAEEEEVLFRQMRTLAFQPMLRKAVGERASKFARTYCDIARSAAAYLDFAEEVVSSRLSITSGNVRSVQTPRIECEPDAALNHLLSFFEGDESTQGYIRHHRHRLLDTLTLIPRGNGTHRLLELSSYLQMPPLISHYGKYAEVEVTGYWNQGPKKKSRAISSCETGEEFRFQMQRLNVERDEFPYQDDYFDVVLCCELIEHLSEDPMHMISEINRILKWDGLVIITTPNVSSAVSIQEILKGRSPYIYGNYNRENINYGLSDRHNREYTPEDVRIVLESGGFEVAELFTKDTWNRPGPEVMKLLEKTGVPLEMRGDNIFAVGRKISAHIERYPHRIYD